MVPQTTRGRCFTHPKCTVSLGKKREKHDGRIVLISPSLHGRATLTWRNSLSLFNVRDVAGRPSLSRTLCQSMIAVAQRNHRTEHRKEDVIQKWKRWDTIKLCEHYTYIPSILFTNSSSPFALLSPLFVHSAIWPCFIKLHFFVSLSDLFQCENILKWIVSPTEEMENFIWTNFQRNTRRIKLNNIIHNK